MNGKKAKRRKRRLRKIGMVLLIIGVICGGIVGTKAGRKIIYKLAAHHIHNVLNNEATQKKQGKMDNANTGEDIFDDKEPILNYLIFGIEEIAGDRNTDSMLIASVNWKEGNIKITSLMRDTYVEIPGYRSNKLNAAYADGGTQKLIDTVEQNYKIHINGYAYVNFENFEKVIDLVGGVPIDLTKEEAYYLDTKNYISEHKNRTVSEGRNLLNGNQALGYCRIRHVNTITNTHDDYGRTERQRRVLSAIFDKCKDKNPIDLISIMDKSLEYVNTDVSEKEIEYILEALVEKHQDKMESYRIPVDGLFQDPRRYEGITYPLILDWNQNILKLYQFIYGDTLEEAQKRLSTWSEK
ncbi:LCP family protein [Anaeromicropila herbilytica]|uniref:Cell envelope-related transcriptional attenuator domain-containing protein n=1 Tax=Anaeromicropila herbilytica TaxID=2785025 RepID=A0A7R7EHG3_9FIRM|nr:LCP family protein [Anaeromicropila herbilytica]BCN28775.1 hypothetical protein bsdtb5_00700 [Anaeromicropila herbilytica]